MEALQTFFIRAKHWQIFIAFATVTCAAVGAMLRSLMRSPQEVFDHLLPFFVAMEVLAMLFAVWVWTLGIFLSAAVPPRLRMKQTFFRISAIFVPLYLPVFGVFSQSLKHPRNVALVLASFALIIPLHFFALFCQAYSSYFVSRALALLENSRPVSFADYVGYFFAIWLFPIGVWIIQPRINRFYADATRPLSS